MAFVSDSSPDQQNQNQTPGQNPLSQQAPITSAPNASSAKGATGQPSNTGPSQPFTNLSSYLTANAPQIQAEGQQIAGGLNQQYGQVTGAVDQAGTNFNSQVSAGYTPLNQGVLDTFSSNPTTVANDPTQASAFKGMYGDSYTGPTSFESTPDYLNLSGQVQSAVTNAQNLQTPAGIQGYFSASSPTYTQGMGTLDAALLQGNPDVVSNIQAAATPFQNLPGYLSSAVTNNNAAVQAATQQAQAAKAAAQGAMGTATTGFSDAISAKQAAAMKQAQDYNTAVQKYQADIATDIPQANSLKSLMSQYGATWNGPALPYLDPNAFKAPDVNNNLPTASSVASSDDYATAQALSALSGGATTLPIDQSTASQAGSWKAPGAVDETPLMDALRNLQMTVGNQTDSTVNVGSSSNLKPFADAGNQWYINLLKELGWHYPGSGSYPGPFILPGQGGGGLGGGTGFGGV